MPEPKDPTPKRVPVRYRAFLLPIILVIVIGLYVYQTISPDKTALLVEANVESVVTIDGKDYGKTPLEVELKGNNVVVRIVPLNSLPYYEAKVRLTSGVKTIVRRNFGDSEVGSSGLIISLEENGGSKADVIIVSSPNDSEVYVNGSLEGVTPLRLELMEGLHEINLFKAGYAPYKFLVNATKGYTLTASAELSRELLDSK